MADADDNKVMDVANPGQTKPDTGSKPMVVGHKSIMTDPTLKTDSTAAPSAEEQLPSKKKLTIQPLSEEEKQSEETTTESEKPAQAEPTAAVPAEKAEETFEDTTPEDSPEEKKSDAEEEIDEEQAKLEKEAQLQEIVKSKKYYVPIKAQSTTAIKTFLLTFMIVCLIGVIVLAGLIDAEILDLGIELPFDFL